jgi:hypothetical protein
MDNFNINNLFNLNIANKNTLDVNTIHQPIQTFNIQTIIKNKEKKRKELLEIYVKYYDNCLKKIEYANHLNKTDLLYSVDAFIPELIEYKSQNCIEYIIKKLKENYFDVCIVDKKTIFITWLYLEINTNTNTN